MVIAKKKSVRVMEVSITSDELRLKGVLTLPPQPEGLIIWVRNGENTRLRVHDQALLESFQRAGLGILLLDLLSDWEKHVDRSTLRLGSHVPLLAGRLQLGIEWAMANDWTRDLNIGLFGTEAGGAAVLVASIQRAHRIRAIVCEGGHYDLRSSILSDVKVPTLLIAGTQDEVILANNQQAAKKLSVESKLVTIGGLGRVVGRSKKVAVVAEHAEKWFREHLN